MSRGFGLAPASAVKAREQLQVAGYPQAGVQPLPAGTPGRVSAASLGFNDPGVPLTFYVIGDSGGINDPTPQKAVAAAMAQVVTAPPAPAFVYHVGDVVYFNGDASQYVPQFYEPYAHLQLPFLAIPGNHDGDTTDDASRAPLDTFMANFCSPTAGLPPGDPQFEYGRDTETQPYCDWTLDLTAVTIVGLYSNVPSGGVLSDAQVTWLTDELAEASASKPLIVALHHPPYSVDAHHGGSQTMGDALDTAFQKSGRYPDMVMSGHVHDFQVFTRSLDGHQIKYIVVGNSGYHNLHALAGDATPGMDLGDGVVFNYGDDSHWGFLRLTVSGTIGGDYFGFNKDGSQAVSYSL